MSGVGAVATNAPSASAMVTSSGKLKAAGIAAGGGIGGAKAPRGGFGRRFGSCACPNDSAYGVLGSWSHKGALALVAHSQVPIINGSLAKLKPPSQLLSIGLPIFPMSCALATKACSVWRRI